MPNLESCADQLRARRDFRLCFSIDAKLPIACLRVLVGTARLGFHTLHFLRDSSSVTWSSQSTAPKLREADCFFCIQCPSCRRRGTILMRSQSASFVVSLTWVYIERMRYSNDSQIEHTTRHRNNDGEMIDYQASHPDFLSSRFLAIRTNRCFLIKVFSRPHLLHPNAGVLGRGRGEKSNRSSPPARRLWGRWRTTRNWEAVEGNSSKKGMDTYFWAVFGNFCVVLR